MKESHFVGDFDAIFGDFFGWDWGTLAILRQNPNKITAKFSQSNDDGRLVNDLLKPSVLVMK